MYHMYIIGEYFSLEYIILERVQLSVVSNGRVCSCAGVQAWSVERGGRDSSTLQPDPCKSCISICLTTLPNTPHAPILVPSPSSWTNERDIAKKPRFLVLCHPSFPCLSIDINNNVEGEYYCIPLRGSVHAGPRRRERCWV